MRARTSSLWFGLPLIVAGALALTDTPPAQSDDLLGDDGCPATSDTTSHTGTTLQGFADDSTGVVYDPAGAALQLKKAGGLFESTNLPVSDTFNVAAAADFDKDGWTDMVVGSSGDRFVRFYKNRTYESPEPDWTDPDDVRQPNFVRTTDIEPASSYGGDGSMAAADFNGDGNPDFVYFRNDSNRNTHIAWARMYLGEGDGTFESPYQLVDSLSDLGYFTWSSTNAVVIDYNKDGWMDILFGTKLTTGSNSGAVLALINDCPDVATTPRTKCSKDPEFGVVTVLSGLNLGEHGANAIVTGEFTGDGVTDLVMGSVSCCSSSSQRLRLYPGLAGGGFSSSYQSITHVGAATVTLAADFSLDGKLDLVVGSDNWNYGSNLGGKSYYYKNNGTSTPFSGGVTQQLSEHSSSLPDFDLGVVLDYDQDPDRTPDFMIADGNDAGSFYMFANRVVQQFVECGEVDSGVLDLGALEDEEMVVTAARLSPTMSLPSGTSVTFYMSNENPANWQLATPCTDDPDSYCVSFPKPVGRSVRWKASMCSDAGRTKTPSISGVEIGFDYTPAEQHFRAGVVVYDGVAYVGAFRQPGQRGHFYAFNAGLTTTYWDAAARLDAMSDSDRKIYTADVDGNTRLDFTVSNANSKKLQDTLGAGSRTQAENVIAWQRSARFGIDDSSKLGSVETSTAAIIVPPIAPAYYQYLSGDAKSDLDTFLSEHSSRPSLVLFGSRDGALHAVRTDPTDIDNAGNGEEVWAYVPPKVAFGLISDMSAGTETSYPDGSPTLADVKLSDGEYHTVAIVAGGNGGKGVFALDVTDTVSDSGSVSGPIPLWHIVPGGANAGQAYSKPAVARVSVGGTERFIAILATGTASENPDPPYTRGLDVVAVDIAAGNEMWQFRAACPVTTDVVVFETDDDGEGTSIDGFIDRVMFADKCGNLYKVDPGQDLSGGWASGLGSIDTGATDGGGSQVTALFSVDKSTGALGEERPISGTIGARPDASGRMTLFFGTGGVESYDPGKINEFYAVYADTGEVRNKITGTCDAAGNCEKFYGGVVVTPEQALVTRAIDPPVGSNACEFGSSELVGLDLNSLGEDFVVATSSATVSALYGAGGAVYFSTLSGDVVRVGTPVASEAGGESGGEGGGSQNGDEATGFSLVGWRQIL